MDICKATRKYEGWLGKQIPLIEEDLDRKHSAMTKDVFTFLRATFYRWIQLWPEVCRSCDDAPQLLGVGDLHIDRDPCRRTAAAVTARGSHPPLDGIARHWVDDRFQHGGRTGSEHGAIPHLGPRGQLGGVVSGQ